MKKSAIISIATVVLLATFACKIHASRTLVPSENTVTLTKNVNPFSKIDAGGIINVIYKTGPKHSVIVRVPENMRDNVSVKVDKNTLDLGTRNLNNVNIKGSANIVVTVTSPRLKEVELGGTATFKAETLSTSSDNIIFDLGGASKATVNAIRATKVDVDLSGASHMYVGEITATRAVFDLSGASHLGLKALRTQNLGIDLSGAVGIKWSDVKVSGKTSIDVSGATSVTLSGVTESLVLDASGATSANLKNFKAQKGSVDVSGTSSVNTNIEKITGLDTSGVSHFKNHK